jgi:putative transposase
MKRGKLSDSQIFNMLDESDAGVPAVDLCRKYKVASSTYYKMKSKYAGMSLSDLKRLKELEKENSRLKAMYAEISLNHKILQEVVEKKFPEILE